MSIRWFPYEELRVEYEKLINSIKELPLPRRYMIRTCEDTRYLFLDDYAAEFPWWTVEDEISYPREKLKPLTFRQAGRPSERCTRRDLFLSGCEAWSKIEQNPPFYPTKTSFDQEVLLLTEPLCLSSMNVLFIGDGSLTRVSRDEEAVKRFSKYNEIRSKCSSYIYTSKSTKKMLASTLRRFFSKGKTTFYLFLSGPMGRSGRFNEMLDFESLLSAWKRRSPKSKQILVVVINACYSGAWAFKAKSMDLDDVVIQTACGPEEAAMDGVFIPLWVEQYFKRERIETMEKQLKGYSMSPCLYLPEWISKRYYDGPRREREIAKCWWDDIYPDICIDIHGLLERETLSSGKVAALQQFRDGIKQHKTTVGEEAMYCRVLTALPGNASRFPKRRQNWCNSR